MRARRMIAVVACAALLTVGSVTATLAYFTDTDSAQNTFVVGKLFADPESDFTLWEHKAVDEDSKGNCDGVYGLTSEEVKENEYVILPGVSIPKDPTVDIVNLEADAYLYIKVAGSLPEGVSCSVDPAKWTSLQGYPDVYVYLKGDVISADKNEKKSLAVGILKGNRVVVSDDYEGTAGSSTLSFSAYMVQAAGFDSAEEAWENTYGKN